jgi:hypothetical protein
LILAFWAVFFLTVFRNSIFGFVTKTLPSAKVGDLELDEGLPNYFETLDEHDRNWSVKEEENARA